MDKTAQEHILEVTVTQQHIDDAYEKLKEDYVCPFTLAMEERIAFPVNVNTSEGYIDDHGESMILISGPYMVWRVTPQIAEFVRAFYDDELVLPQTFTLGEKFDLSEEL